MDGHNGRARCLAHKIGFVKLTMPQIGMASEMLKGIHRKEGLATFLTRCSQCAEGSVECLEPGQSVEPTSMRILTSS